MAQLVERRVRNAEVRGSTPLGSTKKSNDTKKGNEEKSKRLCLSQRTRFAENG